MGMRSFGTSAVGRGEPFCSRMTSPISPKLASWSALRCPANGSTAGFALRPKQTRPRVRGSTKAVSTKPSCLPSDCAITCLSYSWLKLRTAVSGAAAAVAAAATGASRLLFCTARKKGCSVRRQRWQAGRGCRQPGFTDALLLHVNCTAVAQACWQLDRGCALKGQPECSSHCSIRRTNTGKVPKKQYLASP